MTTQDSSADKVFDDDVALLIRATWDGAVEITGKIEADKAVDLLRRIADNIEQGAPSGTQIAP